jgi:hypothetical protein
MFPALHVVGSRLHAAVNMQQQAPGRSKGLPLSGFRRIADRRPAWNFV